ncbi:hypothetical protein BDZ89DRAFT_893582, partial [Hymenopellis radicata]
LQTISMFSSNPSVGANAGDETDPFVLYARSLHAWTLRLWTESRRIVEEEAK